MICCPTIIQSFSLETITTINFTGNRPIVDVIYLQTDGTFLQMGVFTQINFQPTQVIINHGGVASGIVKLLQ